MEFFVKIFEIIIIPLIGLIYWNQYKAISDNKIRIDKLESKVNQQMTKDDVKEIVKMAILEIKNEFHQDRNSWELALKDIKNDIHNIKNHNAGKDGVMIRILELLERKNER